MSLKMVTLMTKMTEILREFQRLWMTNPFRCRFCFEWPFLWHWQQTWLKSYANSRKHWIITSKITLSAQREKIDRERSSRPRTHTHEKVTEREKNKMNTLKDALIFVGHQTSGWLVINEILSKQVSCCTFLEAKNQSIDIKYSSMENCSDNLIMYNRLNCP